MYKRDLITSEIEKLAQVLARIMGLKVELKFAEAQKLFDETLLNGFKLERSLLLDNDISDFLTWLNKDHLDADRLNSLSDFLFSELDFENNLITSQLIAQKLNLIYQKLADDYQIVHLINLGRQKYIQQFIS